jgi:hypothetical protein
MGTDAKTEIGEPASKEISLPLIDSEKDRGLIARAEAICQELAGNSELRLNPKNAPQYEIGYVTPENTKVGPDGRQVTIVTFPGTGASARSQLEITRGIVKTLNMGEEPVKTNAAIIDSSFQPNARGRIEHSHLVRAAFQAMELYKILTSQGPNNDIYLCFRSASAMEAGYLVPVLAGLLDGHQDINIKGVMFMQAAVYKQGLVEFLKGAKEMLSREAEITQLFPSPDSYRQLRIEMAEAYEIGDDTLESYKREILEGIEENSFCPTGALAVIESEITLAKSSIEHHLKNNKLEMVKHWKAKLEEMNASRDRLAARIQSIPEQILSHQVTDKLLEIDRAAVAAWPENNQEIATRKKERYELLKPIVEQYLKGEEKRKGNSVNMMARLAFSVLPKVELIRPMPPELRRRLLDMGIPLLNVFMQKDRVFPGEKAVYRLIDVRREVPPSTPAQEQDCLIVSELAHSHASPTHTDIAVLMGNLLQEMQQINKELESGSVSTTKPPLRRIKV